MINDYELRIVFSFLSDERDRDTVYRVSRQFRRLYRHVAPTNAYFFAMAYGSIAFARRLFDSTYVVPSKSVIEVAFQRKQADHASTLIARCGGHKNISESLRYDLVNTALSKHSQALVEVMEQTPLKENDRSTENGRLMFDDEYYEDPLQWVFEDLQGVVIKKKRHRFVQYSSDDEESEELSPTLLPTSFPTTPTPEMLEAAEFLCWLLDTGRFKWTEWSISFIAEHRYPALLDILLAGCNDTYSSGSHGSESHGSESHGTEPKRQRCTLEQIAQLLRETAAKHTDPFVQRILDSVLDQEREKLLDLLLNTGAEFFYWMRESLDYPIFDHLIYDRGYKYRHIDARLVECMARNGSTRYVYDWLSECVAKDTRSTWKSFAVVFAAVCEYSVDIAFVKRCFALAPFHCLQQWCSINSILIGCFEAPEGSRFGVINLFLREQVVVEHVIDAQFRHILLHTAIRKNAQETIRLLIRQPSVVAQLNRACTNDDDEDDEVDENEQDEYRLTIDDDNQDEQEDEEENE